MASGFPRFLAGGNAVLSRSGAEQQPRLVPSPETGLRRARQSADAASWWSRSTRALKSFAPEYVTDPAKAIFRFYRDTRFSKDKSPYKTQIAASFQPRGLAGDGSGRLLLRGLAQGARGGRRNLHACRRKPYAPSGVTSAIITPSCGGS